VRHNRIIVPTTRARCTAGSWKATRARVLPGREGRRDRQDRARAQRASGLSQRHGSSTGRLSPAERRRWC